MKISASEVYVSKDSLITLQDIITAFRTQDVGGKAKKALPMYTDPDHILSYDTQCKSCKDTTAHEPGIVIREKKYVVETKCSCCKKKKTHEMAYDPNSSLPNI